MFIGGSTSAHQRSVRAQGHNLAPSFENLSQNEKLEIKPPFPTSMESDENIGGCSIGFVTRNLIMKGGPRDF